MFLITPRLGRGEGQILEEMDELTEDVSNHSPS